MKHKVLWTIFPAFVALISSYAQEKREEDSIVMSPSFTTESKRLFQCKPGPWGDLEYYYTYLEAPDEIMEYVNTPSQKTVWNLPDKDIAGLRYFLTVSGVSKVDQEKIFQNSLPFQLGPPFRLYPPSEVLIKLSPMTRAALSRELRKWPANRFHRSPVVIESGNVKEWFKGSKLSSQTVALIERLSYPMANTMAFSDIPLVLSQIKSDREDRLLLKALTRTRSLILRLRVTKDSDFARLKDYWTAGNKNKDILPFMESIAISTELDHIDAAHLLPPLARKYMNTYPSFGLGVDGTFPDSLWTSLNFFNHLPENGFADLETAMRYVEGNFVRNNLPFQFGDLLMVRDSVTGKFIHSCIFIADDIIYTKNGRSLMSPFMLIKLNDLIARYGGSGKLNLEILRKPESPDR